jgi:ANTAR domain
VTQFLHLHIPCVLIAGGAAGPWIAGLLLGVRCGLSAGRSIEHCVEGDGLVSADIATWVIFGLQAGAPTRDGLSELLAGEPPHWAEIHQATGRVAAELGISLEEALVRLRAHAFASGRPLRAIARAVVAGELRLESST